MTTPASFKNFLLSGLTLVYFGSHASANPGRLPRVSGTVTGPVVTGTGGVYTQSAYWQNTTATGTGAMYPGVTCAVKETGSPNTNQKSYHCECGTTSTSAIIVPSTRVSGTVYAQTSCAMSPRPTLVQENVVPEPVCGNRVHAYDHMFAQNRKLKAFSRNQGKDAIEKFCGSNDGFGGRTDGLEYELFYSETDLKAMIPQGNLDKTKYPASAASASDVSVVIGFLLEKSVDQTKCGKLQTPTNHDQNSLHYLYKPFSKTKGCEALLYPLLDGCDTNIRNLTGPAKNGGVERVKTGEGCFDVVMYGVEPQQGEANPVEQKPELKGLAHLVRLFSDECTRDETKKNCDLEWPIKDA